MLVNIPAPWSIWGRIYPFPSSTHRYHKRHSQAPGWDGALISLPNRWHIQIYLVIKHGWLEIPRTEWRCFYRKITYISMVHFPASHVWLPEGIPRIHPQALTYHRSKRGNERVLNATSTHCQLSVQSLQSDLSRKTQQREPIYDRKTTILGML